MESNELLASLAKMEASLNEIDSARKQIQKTITSSTELQEVVRGYVSSVKTLCAGLKSWEADLRACGTSLSAEFESAISHLNSTCTEIINNFDTNLTTQTNEFKNKTEFLCKKFKEENAKLEENVKQLNELSEDFKKTFKVVSIIKEIIDGISNNLENLQRKQEEEFNIIKSKLSDIPSLIHDAVEKVTDSIGILNRNLTKFFEYTKGKFNQVNDKIDNIDGILTNVKNQCETIQTSLDAVKSEIINSKKAILKSSNINRWIIVIGFAIIILLKFFVK